MNVNASRLRLGCRSQVRERAPEAPGEVSGDLPAGPGPEARRHVSLPGAQDGHGLGELEVRPVG